MSVRTAVVTGASTGIGWATCVALRAAGWEVVATARRHDRLQQLADECGATPVPADLTTDDGAAAVAQAAGGASALVNNAGGALGVDPVASASLADWQTMYDRNVLATLRITQALLPQLRQHPSSDVLTVTSTAALAAYEGGGGYCGAKMAERALVETLRLELCGEPVRVTQIAPGMVATEEFSLNRLRGDAEAARKVYEGVGQPLTACDVAESIVWMLTRPAHVNIDMLTVRPVAQAANHKVHRES